MSSVNPSPPRCILPSQTGSQGNPFLKVPLSGILLEQKKEKLILKGTALHGAHNKHNSDLIRTRRKTAFIVLSIEAWRWGHPCLFGMLQILMSSPLGSSLSTQQILSWTWTKKCSNGKKEEKHNTDWYQYCSHVLKPICAYYTITAFPHDSLACAEVSWLLVTAWVQTPTFVWIENKPKPLLRFRGPWQVGLSHLLLKKSGGQCRTLWKHQMFSI